jgi:hypothetical protein
MALSRHRRRSRFQPGASRDDRACRSSVRTAFDELLTLARKIIRAVSKVRRPVSVRGISGCARLAAKQKPKKETWTPVQSPADIVVWKKPTIG